MLNFLQLLLQRELYVCEKHRFVCIPSRLRNDKGQTPDGIWVLQLESEMKSQMQPFTSLDADLWPERCYREILTSQIYLISWGPAHIPLAFNVIYVFQTRFPEMVFHWCKHLCFGVMMSLNYLPTSVGELKWAHSKYLSTPSWTHTVPLSPPPFLSKW